jgi:phosphopantothenoylcysteine synthetase/decarboxylase
MHAESGRHFTVSDMIRSNEAAPVGLVVRLTTDGDEPLPVTRVTVVQMKPTVSREAERNSAAPVRSGSSVRSDNNAAVKALLAAHGYTGPITKKMRTLALEMIENEKHCAQVAADRNK